MRLHRRSLVALALPISMAVAVTTAHAAAPNNDTFAGALAVPIGYSEYLDTTEATSRRGRRRAKYLLPGGRRWCVVLITGDGSEVIVDVTLTSYNSYSAGVIVAVRQPGQLSTSRMRNLCAILC